MELQCEKQWGPMPVKPCPDLVSAEWVVSSMQYAFVRKFDPTDDLIELVKQHACSTIRKQQ